MSQTPDILMLGWELPPANSGGLGVACHGLAQSLARLSTHISFALPRQLPAHIPFMDIFDHDLIGVQVTAINSPLRPYRTAADYSNSVPIPPQGWAQDLYQEAFRFAEAIVRFSQTRHFDLVHAHDWMTFPAGVAASQTQGKPFIAQVHATEYDRTGGYLDSRIADIEARSLHQADKVITVSDYTKQIVCDHYQLPAEKITVVHNGLTPTDFQVETLRRFFPHDHLVLFVGRLTFQKGVEYFLQAAKRVLEAVPNTLFIVAGSGDLYQRHLLEAAYLGISQRVIFTGFLRNQELSALYHAADVFVMPSVSEPYGLVALEAIAAGVPVILSKNSGVKEVIRHAQLVDFWDIHKMAALIVQSILFPNQAHQLNRLAQFDSQPLTWEAAAAKTLALYHQVIA